MQASALADRHLRTALCTAPVRGCRAESSWGGVGARPRRDPSSPTGCLNALPGRKRELHTGLLGGCDQARASRSVTARALAAAGSLPCGVGE